MNSIERRQLAAVILVLLPVLAWSAVANRTEQLPQTHKIRALYQLAIETPHKPYLILAIIGGLIVGILCVWLLSILGKSEFAGAPFRKFLRGTRIVSGNSLRRDIKACHRQQVTIAGIPIPNEIENLHLLIGGGTGSGKSTITGRPEPTL